MPHPAMEAASEWLSLPPRALPLPLAMSQPGLAQCKAQHTHFSVDKNFQKPANTSL